MIVQDSDHVTAQVNVQVSDQVQRLFSAMKQEDYTSADLMQLVGLNYRATFRRNYLNPAIEVGLIEDKIPDKPKNRSKISVQVINLARKINLLHLSLCGEP